MHEQVRVPDPTSAYAMAGKLAVAYAEVVCESIDKGLKSEERGFTSITFFIIWVLMNNIIEL